MNDFLIRFAELFDDNKSSEIKENTEFKELDEWSSVMALNVIAMVNEEYDVALKGDDIRESNTVADLFKIVKARA